MADLKISQLPSVTTLDIVPSPDYNSVNIKFSYRLLRSNENDSVILTIQNM